jgi:hypothetical protein
VVLQAHHRNLRLKRLRLRRLRQEDREFKASLGYIGRPCLREFKASLGYIGRPCLKKKKKKGKRKKILGNQG